MTKKEEKREPQQTELAQTIGGYINNHSIIMYNSPTIHYMFFFQNNHLHNKATRRRDETI